MKTLLTTGWTFMRVFRLVTGIAALVYAIVSADIMLGFAGGFLLLMGILNFGCCGAGGCPIPADRSKSETGYRHKENISYEEIT